LKSLGEKRLDIGYDLPDQYPDFMIMMDKRIKMLRPTEESKMLTREMMYPSQGTLTFRLSSRLLAPIGKALLHEHILKEFGLQKTKFDVVMAWFTTMVIRTTLPIVPLWMIHSSNLIRVLRFEDPRAGSILNYGAKKANVNISKA
jgi:hypothetical protein